MLFAMILSGLTGCATYSKGADGVTTMKATTTVQGLVDLSTAEAVQTAVGKSNSRTPVTIIKTAQGTEIRVGNSYGYVGNGSYDPLHRADGANSDRVRAQWMIDHGMASPSSGSGVTVGGTISASNVKIDPSVRCPSKGDPTSVAEDLACKQADLDANTIAIENNPAVRR